MKDIQKKALKIIQNFPKSKNGNHFLSLKNGQKVYFKIFIKKYGLDNSSTNYNSGDLKRRLYLVECFDYLLKKYDKCLQKEKGGKKYFVIETVFFRFILLQKKNKHLECLSFFPK